MNSMNIVGFGAILLHSVLLASTSCPGEISSNDIHVLHRFSCSHSELSCVALLGTFASSYYAANALCTKLNGTLLELRDATASRCFEREKLRRAPTQCFWLNVVEVGTPRCKGPCTDFSDLRWASELPPKACLVRSKHARSCSNNTSSSLSCSEKGCCEIIIDGQSAFCVLPNDLSAGTLTYKNFSSKEHKKVIKGRHCAYIESSWDRNGGNGNAWRLTDCESAMSNEGCKPGEIQVACAFPKRPSSAVTLETWTSGKRQIDRPCQAEKEPSFKRVPFWVTVGVLLAAAGFVLILITCWFRIHTAHKPQQTFVETFKHVTFKRDRGDTYLSDISDGRVEIENPNFRQDLSDWY